MKKIYLALAIVGTAGIAGIGLVTAQDAQGHDLAEQKNSIPMMLAQEGKPPMISSTETPRSSQRYNGFEVGGEPDRKVKAKFEQDGKWIEVVAIGQITEDEIVAWGPDGKKSAELAKLFEKKITSPTPPGLRTGRTPGLTFKYGKKNRYFLVRKSNQQEFIFPNIGYDGAFTSFFGGSRSDDLELIPIAFEKGEKTGSIRCLFTGGTPTIEEIRWTGKSGEQSKSKDFLVEEVAQFDSLRELNKNARSQIYIQRGGGDAYKHGVSRVTILKDGPRTSGDVKIEIVDKDGKVLDQVGKTGVLSNHSQGSDRELSMEDIEEQMYDWTYNQRVGSASVLFDGKRTTHTLIIPTKKLDNIDRLRITRTPRVLIDFVDLPLDPK